MPCSPEDLGHRQLIEVYADGSLSGRFVGLLISVCLLRITLAHSGNHCQLRSELT